MLTGKDSKTLKRPWANKVNEFFVGVQDFEPLQKIHSPQKGFKILNPYKKFIRLRRGSRF